MKSSWADVTSTCVQSPKYRISMHCTCVGFVYFAHSSASEDILGQGHELSISIKSIFACYQTFISLLYADIIQTFGIFRVE